MTEIDGRNILGGPQEHLGRLATAGTAGPIMPATSQSRVKIEHSLVPCGPIPKADGTRKDCLKLTMSTKTYL